MAGASKSSDERRILIQFTNNHNQPMFSIANRRFTIFRYRPHGLCKIVCTHCIPASQFRRVQKYPQGEFVPLFRSSLACIPWVLSHLFAAIEQDDPCLWLAGGHYAGLLIACRMISDWSEVPESNAKFASLHFPVPCKEEEQFCLQNWFTFTFYFLT